MSGEEVDRAVRRIETRRPDLNMAVQSVAGGLTAGEGVDMIHQAALQQFLWWHLPRDYPQDEWHGLVEATALLLGELGLKHWRTWPDPARRRKCSPCGVKVAKKEPPPSAPHTRSLE